MEDALQVLREGQDDGLHVLRQPGQSPWTHREVLLLRLALQQEQTQFGGFPTPTYRTGARLV